MIYKDAADQSLPFVGMVAVNAMPTQHQKRRSYNWWTGGRQTKIMFNQDNVPPWASRSSCATFFQQHAGSLQFAVSNQNASALFFFGLCSPDTICNQELPDSNLFNAAEVHQLLLTWACEPLSFTIPLCGTQHVKESRTALELP